MQTYEQAIEHIGFGRFQKKLMLVCGLGWAADAMEVLLISFALPALSAEWNLSNAEKGWLGTAIFLGMLAGAWFWGRLSDRLGRKFGFISTVAIDSIFGLLSAFSPSFIWLVIFRALTGFGVGGTLPVDYSIFSEYLPTRQRGRNLVLLEAFWALGSIAAAGLAWLVVPTLGWRWLLALSAVPGLIIFFIRRDIPESPRYLLANGQPEAARKVLEEVARQNGVTLSPEPLAIPPAARPAKTSDLFNPALRRTTLLLWGLWFAISLGYYGVFTWLPSYFKASGMEMLPVYQNTFLLALAQLPGYFSAAWLVERWGRRRTLAVYLAASGVFTYLFAAVNGLNFMVGMGAWMSFFTLGAWGVIYTITPEAYPTHLRGTGMGAASSMTRLAGAIAPTLGAALMGVSLLIPLTIYAVAYLIAGGMALALPHETRARPLADTLQEASAAAAAPSHERMHL
ncbi:MAG TPA: MFS transporter [Anaerolineaceae bacterium]|nr:MFS transporter [Anaerolineaceae bacterium]HPN53823.1 MFS transporter [Anaerolineaceae bacterium]